MKKVLIISYYFPPANFVGAERTEAWARYLKDSGYFPIILTRCWNEGQTNPLEKVLKNDLVHEQYDSHEVYRLPIRRTLRDRASSFPWLAPIQKALTFLELIQVNYFIRSLPYVAIYRKAQELLKADPEIKVVIASGRPFQSFFMGHRLKKEYNILWIPDYRDEWTTNQNHQPNKLLTKFIHQLEKRSEIKWTSNADFFVSTSDTLVRNISKFIKKEGISVLNGYNKFNEVNPVINDSRLLNLFYSGTLYPYQNIEIIVQAVKNIGDGIVLSFVGINTLPEEKKRVEKLISGSSAFVLLDRMGKESYSSYTSIMDIQILTSYNENKGWYPVKLFEYYASGKPILLCPSDKDVMEEFVLKTNSGFVANTVEECEAILRECLAKKQNGEIILFERNLVEGEKYSRRYQTKILAEHLDSIYNK